MSPLLAAVNRRRGWSRVWLAAQIVGGVVLLGVTLGLIGIALIVMTGW